MTNYTEPKILISKDGYYCVYIRYNWDGKRIKKVYKAGINRYKKPRERMQQAIALRDALKEKLKSGWNPITHHTGKKTISEVLAHVLEIKKASLRKSSIKSYRYIIKTFTGWLAENNLSFIYVHNLTGVQVRKYLDSLLTEKKYSALSYNIHFTILKSMFAFLLERELIDKNPFMGIKTLPVEHGKNVAYTDEEREKIKNYLLANDIKLYYAVSFIYYCFLRRSELIQLKVGDIDFQNKTIRIQSAVSKTRKQQSVTIPKSLEAILYEMGLDKLPTDKLIFDFKPDELSDKITAINKKLGITGKSIYGFKHSGVVALYTATHDPVLTSLQCRHSDLKTTMIYLRSLGLTVDERVRQADFKM